MNAIKKWLRQQLAQLAFEWEQAKRTVAMRERREHDERMNEYAEARRTMKLDPMPESRETSAADRDLFGREKQEPS